MLYLRGSVSDRGARVFVPFLSASEAAAGPGGVSVLRLFRRLGLRGVQILAACFLGEKGLLWYAPDQQRDTGDRETIGPTTARKAQLTVQTRVSPI